MALLLREPPSQATTEAEVAAIAIECLGARILVVVRLIVTAEDDGDARDASAARACL